MAFSKLQSNFKWINSISTKIKYAVDGFIREQLPSNHVPNLVRCLCINYYFDRDTFDTEKTTKNWRLWNGLCLDSSRRTAQFNCVRCDYHLFGSVATVPGFKGIYQWTLKMTVPKECRYIVSFGIYTEFVHPINGRLVRASYGVERYDERPLVLYTPLQRRFDLRFDTNLEVLQLFIDRKQVKYDWDDPDSVSDVSWRLIAYMEDDGGYEVLEDAADCGFNDRDVSEINMQCAYKFHAKCRYVESLEIVDFKQLEYK